MLYPYAEYQDRSTYNPLFPLFIYYDLLSTPGGVRLHWHEEIEFLSVLRGKVDLQYGSQNIVLQKGDMAFLNSSILHGYRPNPDSDTIPLVRPILINPSLLTSNGYDIIQSKYISPLLAGEINPPMVLRAEDDASAEIGRMLDLIAHYLSEGTYGHEIMIKSCVFNLLAALLLPCKDKQNENSTRAEHSKVDSDRFKKLLVYIYENYNRKITITDLAEYMNMSEGHFSRFFKKMANKTAIEYINEYKISQAAKMLQETDKKEIEIAMDIGFDNFSYFISTFKSIVHCTPSQYRKKERLQIE